MPGGLSLNDGVISVAALAIALSLASVWYRAPRSSPLRWPALALALVALGVATALLDFAHASPLAMAVSLGAGGLAVVTALRWRPATAATPSARPSAASDLARAGDDGLALQARLAEALRDLQAAEEASRSKDEFLALLSHELRTPLHAMTTWLEIAERERPEDVPPQVRRTLTALRRTAAALGRLVEDLLDSSRIATGKLSLEHAPFDAVETVASTVNAMLALAEERGIALEFAERAAPAVVQGDSRRLGQAIRALIDNALKFTSRGGRVSVTTRQEAGEIEIAIADDGVGIAAEMLPRIFDQFTQADTSRSRRQSGLGLGLFLVKSIAERHGGRVAAESPGPDRGATFRLWLPVAPGAEPVPVLDPVARRVGRLSGLRILLIEDDISTAEAMEEILIGGGAQVEVALSAGAARAAFRSGSFDLLISDIGLPDEDGIALVHALRTWEQEVARPRTPAVAMSGYTSPGEVADMIAAGFDQHVAKPIADFDALCASLASLAGRPDA